MTDRPIIFSGPMVRALLAGRKTQTRRLASSPLRRVEAGDRLYVRESYSPIPWADAEHPHRWNLAYAATGSGDYVVDAPTDFNPTLYGKERWTPSIHMPRWASRLTLIVEGVKVEPLQVISEADAIAEGIERIGAEHGAGSRPTSFDKGPNFYTVNVDGWAMNAPKAANVYHMLWDCLHGAGEAAKNPDVVALTFRVERGNIDRVSSPAITGCGV